MKLNKLIKSIICIALMMIMMPISTKADERIEIKSAEASFDMSQIYYGRDIQSKLNVSYETGNFYSIDRGMISLHKYNESTGEWKIVNSGTVDEGKWRVHLQLRSDYSSYVLADDVTLKINGKFWEKSGVTYVFPQYSMCYFDSQEIIINKPTGGELSFSTGSTTIPKTYTNTAMSSINLNSLVAGGVEPYKFEKVSGPEWLKVSTNGIVSGTPTIAGSNTELVVKVTDAPGSSKQATLKVDQTIVSYNDRTQIKSVIASLDGSKLSYGLDVSSIPYFSYEDGKGYYIQQNMSTLKKYDTESEEWKVVNSGIMDEGQWKLCAQVRTNDFNYVLADNVTLTVNGTQWTLNNKVYVSDTYSFASFDSPAFTVSKPVLLTGTATLSNAYYHTHSSPDMSSELQVMQDAGKLNYQWQKCDYANGVYADIEGANDITYYPVEEDVGKYIRVVISANGYNGSVISNNVKVEKMLINLSEPVAPEVVYYDASGKVVVQNAKAGQEYFMTFTDSAPIIWNLAVKAIEDGSIEFTPIATNSTLYVHTRVAETDYAPAGKISKYGSVFVKPSTMNDIVIEPADLKIKVGDVIKLSVKSLPDDTYTNAFWFANVGNYEVKLYIDENCEIEYVRDTHGLRTNVYLKALKQTNGVTVGAEKTISSTPIVKNMNVVVTDENGNYSLNSLILETVSLMPGESVNVNVDTLPSPAVVGALSFEKTSGPSETSVLTLSSSDSKTITIYVPEDADVGTYYYNVKVDGADTKIPSGIRINVLNKDAKIPAESVIVTPTTITLAPGESANLSAIINPVNALENTVLWIVVYDDSGKVKVDQSGKVTVAADAIEKDYTVRAIATTGGPVALDDEINGVFGECILKVAVPKYNISVIDGKAYNGETEITGAIVTNTLVDLVANDPTSGKEFDKWVVISGDVVLADGTYNKTMFSMPKNNVIVQATYKNVKVEEKPGPEETPKPTDTPNPGTGNGGQSGSTGSNKNNVTSDGYVVPNTGVK